MLWRIRQLIRTDRERSREYRRLLLPDQAGKNDHAWQGLHHGDRGGFGRPTALALLDQRDSGGGQHPPSRGAEREAVAELEAAGARIVEMDVTDTASTEAGVAQAIAGLGGLDVLFNNAGIGSYGIQELMSPEDMARVFDVNVTGVQRVMRAALPRMRAQGRGTVLYTSSLIGRIATPFYGTYSASKWALEAIVECYRTELSGFGIETCIIEPGAMPTAFFDGMVAPTIPTREAGYGDFAEVPAMSGGRAGADAGRHDRPASRADRRGGGGPAGYAIREKAVPHGRRSHRGRPADRTLQRRAARRDAHGLHQLWHRPDARPERLRRQP